MSRHLRRNLVRAAAVLVLIIACWALYESLTAPSRAVGRVEDRQHSDNATLCDYFRGEDLILGDAARSADPDVANWLNGLRANARAVVASPICSTRKP